MSWEDIMRRVLPPVGRMSPGITSAYGVIRDEGTSPHRGVDFNYPVGRTGINLTNPALRAPVDGIVTNAGEGRYGTISIRDANGFSHEILHTHSRHVSVGDPVVAGQLIGTMGNTGVDFKNPKEGANHVHYQLRDPSGHAINPTEFWDQQGPANPNPAPPSYLGEYQHYLRDYGPDAGGSEFSNAPGAVTMLAARSLLPEPSTPANAGEIVRRLGRRVAGSSFFDKGTAAVPAVPPDGPLSPDRSDAFDARFGNWASSLAPGVPNQPKPSPQVNGLPGIVSGQPMPNYPVPPPIWGPPGDSRTTSDDENWYARWRRLMIPE